MIKEMERLSISRKQIATRNQQVMKRIHKHLLTFSGKINHHIPAKNDIELRRYGRSSGKWFPLHEAVQVERDK